MHQELYRFTVTVKVTASSSNVAGSDKLLIKTPQAEHIPNLEPQNTRHRRCHRNLKVRVTISSSDAVGCKTWVVLTSNLENVGPTHWTQQSVQGSVDG